MASFEQKVLAVISYNSRSDISLAQITVQNEENTCETEIFSSDILWQLCVK